MAKCDCYYQQGMHFRCFGTKNIERCNCGGDTAKCDFYPEKRNPKKTVVVDMSTLMTQIKPKADSTLYNMKKSELIEYIRCLEHNYNVAVSFNENQARYIESLNLGGK